MEEILSIQKTLKKGLYYHNLRELISQCNSLIDSKNPLAFFILRSIFSELQNRWSEYKLPTEEYDSVCSKLVGPIEKLLDLISKEESKTKIDRQLIEIVKIFVNF